MNKFTSNERKGAIALVLVMALVVGCLALSRRSLTSPEQLPGAQVENASSALSSSESGASSDSLKSKKTKSAKRKASQRKNTEKTSWLESETTRHRDYLNEKINE